jgi:hypothetical protein
MVEENQGLVNSGEEACSLKEPLIDIDAGEGLKL